MRLLLKILATPIILTLAAAIWICSALLYYSAYIFGLVGTLLGIAGLATLILHSVQYGLLLLLAALLLSPLGFPMAAALVLAKLQDLRYALQERVFG